MRPAPIEGDPPRGRLLEILEHLSLWLARKLFGRLPARLGLVLGATAGRAYGAAARLARSREHRVATLNLEIAFPECSRAEREAIRGAMWRNWGRSLVEVVRLERLDRDELRTLVELDPPDGPAEIFRRARVGGSIVLTAHFGAFELLHAGCAAHGYPITIVHRTLPNRRVDRWLTEVRERCGTTVLRRGAAAREVLRALREGRVVALPFDQRPEAGGVFAPFFSLPALTSSAVARFAIASGVPVFPVVLVREGTSARHRAVFGPPVCFSRTGRREEDVYAATCQLNAVLADLIRAHPDHWIWMYARWKPQPGDLPSPYRVDAPPLAHYRDSARSTQWVQEARRTRSLKRTVVPAASDAVTPATCDEGEERARDAGPRALGFARSLDPRPR